MDAPPDKSPPVVLIVEDDPLLRLIAVEVVEEAGFVTLEAGDADAAAALLESRPDFLCCLRTSTCPEAWTG
jgi:CheY-like chemotaxis protein